MKLIALARIDSLYTTASNPVPPHPFVHTSQ